MTPFKARTTTLKTRTRALAAGFALAVPSVAHAQWTSLGNLITYNSGNVAIGTTNPAGKFDVRSNGTRTISAFNNATTGYNYAVHGTSLSNNGRGVYGIAQNIAGNGAGVFGVSNGFIGRGVYGYSTDGRGGASYGVEGKANSSGGAGVFGQNAAGVGVLGNTGSTTGSGSPTTAVAGVRGVVTSTTPGAWAGGVWGINNSTTGNGIGVGGFTAGTGYGVYGQAGAANGYGGYFVGDRNYFSGNLGIGDAAPVHMLDVAGDLKIRTGDKFYFGAISENSDTIYFERTNSGNNATLLDLVIGDDPGGSLEYFRIRNSTGTPNTFWFGSDGNAWKNGGGDWSNSSDRRIKRDITTLEGSLDRLLRLRGVHFYYTDLSVPGAAEGLQTGFVAQEVETVFPEWVVKAPGNSQYTDLKGLSITGFEALTVEALREMRAESDAKVAAVRAEALDRVAALEAENGALRDRLASLEALMATLMER